MKTKTIFLILTISTLLTGCCLKHEYSEPSCTEPATCIKCGETEGESLGHTWVDANCTEAKHCETCGSVEGEPLGHNFSEPTCTEESKCLVCNITQGQPLGHDFKEADYENPKTCQLCGLTEGEPLPAETTIEENTESLEVETPKTDTRTQEQIDADVQAVIDEIYRRRGIDPNTMQQGHIDAPPPEGGTPSTGERPGSNFGSSGPSEHLKGAVIQ